MLNEEREMHFDIDDVFCITAEMLCAYSSDECKSTHIAHAHSTSNNRMSIQIDGTFHDEDNNVKGM
jgi:hypothetical protein